MTKMKLSPDWICGFVEGEGSFVIFISEIKSSGSKQVRLFFKVTQHVKNVQVLYALKTFFGVGLVKRQRKDPNQCWEFVVSRFEHLQTKIIPYPNHTLHTTKKFDFFRFRKAALIMSQKKHLTVEGMDKIKAIASRMNQLNAYSEIDGLDAYELEETVNCGLEGG